MKLNREGYEALIEGDLSWLMRQPRTLERDHVAEVLKASVDHEYPAVEVEATAALRADLAKANAETQRLLGLTRCPCGRNGGVVWCEACDSLAKAQKERDELLKALRYANDRLQPVESALAEARSQMKAIKYEVQMAYRQSRLDGTYETPAALRLHNLITMMGWEFLT